MKRYQRKLVENTPQHLENALDGVLLFLEKCVHEVAREQKWDNSHKIKFANDGVVVNHPNFGCHLSLKTHGGNIQLNYVGGSFDFDEADEYSLKFDSLLHVTSAAVVHFLTKSLGR